MRIQPLQMTGIVYDAIHVYTLCMVYIYVHIVYSVLAGT